MTIIDVLAVTAADRDRALAGGWAGIVALPACETCDGHGVLLSEGIHSEPEPVGWCQDCTDGTLTPERVAIVAPCEACGGWGYAFDLGPSGESVPIGHCNGECEGGGMLLYGVAEITEALPVETFYASPDEGSFIEIQYDDHNAAVLSLWAEDDDGGWITTIIPADTTIGEFAPGGVALHLAAARLVTDPGGCPFGPHNTYDDDERSYAECPTRCEWPGGLRITPRAEPYTGHLLAPWAAPGLPSTPGLHRWEGA